ncbi:sterol desaturase/sphingolipid hydroxylase (fatty acid hydroxylase superfamily) [Hoeflea marina]|uniref:Sterol desaturase/sphingolipid hydroxylase (Fatty acid hydroxylase superfamily) n=1 Tax=Hoeflea marina TaxID=274592 RepID=A0A317PJ58_9HYPH|nr:sterol desaturase family protein [Hoeflea marina]PWV99895.1 sterol desaturase/sphingolipid hydroxylase (fatty acid hydroxylase superfamily) [Hoeflea marina]
MTLFGLTEPVLRLTAFGLIFACLSLTELLAPRLERAELHGAWKSRRWATNIAMVVLSSLALRIIFPLAAVGTALWAASNGYGLFAHVGLPAWLAGIIAFVVLDFAVWLEHLVSHKWTWLWRIHRMHHADTGIDLTTALRFHPLEIVLSMLWKATVIVALGPPAIAVLVFEIVLNGSAMFNHANIKLPIGVDRWLRTLIVTPDMHRIHHSTDPRETDSNYGFNLAVWDRLFATYTHRPRLGDEKIEIGLSEYRGLLPASLPWALALPFRSRPAGRRED